MTQDFAKAAPRTQPAKTARKSRSNTRRTTPTSKSPGWTYWIIGLLLATVMGLVLFIVNNPPAKPLTSGIISKKTLDKVKQAQPRFDFYEILKKQTVEVPDRSREISAKLSTDIDYYLQAGSFRKPSDAEKLRAQLLLLNLNAFVEMGDKQGQSWHRVIVGPFHNRSKVAKARSTLASNNLNPLLLRRESQ